MGRLSSFLRSGVGWLSIGPLACACSQLLQSSDATFKPAGGGDAAGADAPSGLPPELACFDESRSAPPGRVEVEFVLFDRNSNFMFRAIDGGVSLSGQGPQEGVSIVACSASDPFCHDPVTPKAVTDADGVARLSVPGDFDGFYDVSREDLYPATYYPGAPRIGRASKYYVALYPTNVDAYLRTTLHVSLNPALGHIGAAVYDCNHLPLETAIVDTMAEFELRQYFTAGNMSLPKDYPTGARIFVNGPEGETTVTVQANGGLLAERAVYIRPGSVALVDFLGR
jgi:hypothetical protein